MNLFKLAAVILSAWIVWPASLFAQVGYDELRYSDGEIREPYRDIYQLYQQFSATDIQEKLRASRAAFQGDNALDPLPRVLPAEEYDAVLKRGVEQRAKAISAFLSDLHSGQKRFQSAQIFPPDVLERIIDRSLETRYLGQVNASAISFFYGPDIIRDRSGVWRVIEDNPGYIGGIGDLKLAQELTLQTYPELLGALRVRNSEAFYAEVAKRFKSRAAKFGSNKVIMMMFPPYPDNEDLRMRKLFGKYGIEVVTPFSKAELVINDSGAWLYSNRDRRVQPEKVGYIFLNGEHTSLDPMNPAAGNRAIIETARFMISDEEILKMLSREEKQALKQLLSERQPNSKKIQAYLESRGWGSTINQDFSGLRNRMGVISAAKRGVVGLNYTPGIDFIGDKEFYMYVEELIRFYLNEEPVIKNIPTRSFAMKESGSLNQRLLEKVFGDVKKFVIKKVDGRGGDAVWVGPKIKSQELARVKERIIANPGDYIVQEFTPLSEMNDKIVDVRVIAEVSGQNVFVTDTPWGRGLPKSGNGKVNLSDQGREITVLIREGVRYRCENALLKN